MTKNICPFCKQDNNCQHNNAKECWCMATEIPESLLKLLPKTKVGKACICKDCITFYSIQKEAFLEKYCTN